MTRMIAKVNGEWHALLPFSTLPVVKITPKAGDVVDDNISEGGWIEDLEERGINVGTRGFGEPRGVNTY